MRDLKLDPNTHDIVLENFTVPEVKNKHEELSQRLKIKLLFFKGEWFANREYGIPYFQKVFIKGVRLNEIDNIYISQILDEQDVSSIESYSSLFNPATRMLSIKCKVLGIDGAVYNISLEL